MLLGPLWGQVVVMELLNYGHELMWGGWGGDAALQVQAMGVGCVPRAWGMLRRKIKMVMRELKGSVFAPGMDAMQTGVRGWTRALEKGKLFLLSCWSAAIAWAPSYCRVLVTLCWMDKPSWDSPILALCGFVPTFNRETVVQSRKANEVSGAVLLSDLSLEKSILMSHPDGKQLKPVGCIYSLWCSAVSLTSAPQQNPFVMQDGTGVEIN